MSPGYFDHDGDQERLAIRDELLCQLVEGRTETWREKKDKEFGL